MSTIEATHSNLQRTGRFHETDKRALQCAWSGCTLTMNFKGTSVHASIRDYANGAEGNHLILLVDNDPPITLELKSGIATYCLVEDLPQSEHSLQIFKQTEASVGHIEFISFTIPNGVLLPIRRTTTRRIEFIGDSITCGYGNESADPNETYTPSTENHYYSYAQRCTRAFDAEAHIVAWSGEGLLRNALGDVVNPLPSIYGQVLPPSGAPTWNFSTWIPQVVVINLGTNDFLTGAPEREAFLTTYAHLIDKLEQHYNAPHIFCCLGPMIEDKALPIFRAFLKELKERTESIHILEFTSLQQGEHGADWHPNLVAHQRMAETLYDAIQKVTHW